MKTKPQTRLRPGPYRLVEDFGPLLKDKRRTRDWRCQVIKAGTIFFYSEWTYHPNEDKPEVSYTETRLYPVGAYSSESVSVNESEQTRDLEEMLVRIDETPSLWVRREHGGSTGLGALDVLCEEGKITLDDVKQAAEKYLGRLES
jgi:hypothetical protein